MIYLSPKAMKAMRPALELLFAPAICRTCKHQHAKGAPCL